MEETCGEHCKFNTNKTKAHLLRHILAGVSTVVGYDDLGLLPSRVDFLDAGSRVVTAGVLERGTPILFLSNSVFDKDYIYRPHVFGVLPCGQRACVVLKGVEVFFDVMIADGFDSAEAVRNMRGLMTAAGITYVGTEVVEQFPMRMFQKVKSKWVRVYFNSVVYRRQAINWLNTREEEIPGCVMSVTAADDNGAVDFYFKKLARECRFSTAGWNRLTSYRVIKDESIRGCAYVLEIDVKNYNKLTKKAADAYGRKVWPDCYNLPKILNKDPSIIGVWDIETYDETKSGNVPKAGGDYSVFAIGSAYFLNWSQECLLGVCVVSRPVVPRKGLQLLVECKSERELILAHLRVMECMRPDILASYNGGNFDWPLLRDKIERHGLEASVKEMLSGAVRSNKAGEDIKYMFHKGSIKISADYMHKMDVCADIPGIVDIDLMPCMGRLYPRAEVGRARSLNWYLQKNGLPAKEDMGYKKMFRIYERACELSEALRECHCGEKMADCGACGSMVREVDHEAVPMPAGGEGDYSGVLRNGLMDTGGMLRCCSCGKRPLNLKDMSEVAYYCFIDCVRPQQLCVVRNIVSESRSMANLSYTMMRDSFYRADGLRVKNLIGSYCFKNGVGYSDVVKNENGGSRERSFYSGAWVFPPKKGLNNKRPVAAVDFTALYPSIIICYNISPDTVVYDAAVAKGLKDEGYAVYEISEMEYEMGTKKNAAANKKHKICGWTVRHSGLVEKGQKKIVDHYEKIITMADGLGGVVRYREVDGPNKEDRERMAAGTWSRKFEYVPVYGREGLEGERMGVFAAVLHKLFSKRAPLKEERVRLTKEIEQRKSRGLNVDELEFQSVLVGVKDKTLKVYCNTFYGQTGCYISSLYELLVAAAVTAAGQTNIKMVADYVVRLGYEVTYGDTDSLYLCCPPKLYEADDAAYRDKLAELSGTNAEGALVARLEYWSSMVRKTIRDVMELREKISDLLLADNGTTCLNMVYEEVGFPTVFCGKKKYFLTPHVADANFSSGNMLIVGIDTVRQGQANITKKLSDELMAAALSPSNDKELIDIVIEKLAAVCKFEGDVNDYKLSKRYKKESQNVQIQTFVKRMKQISKRAEGEGDYLARDMYAPPENGDKFEFVVLRGKPADLWSEKGRLIKQMVGNYMEYVRVYEWRLSKGEDVEIDKQYYLRGAVTTLFAKFASYHEMFRPDGKVYDGVVEYSVYDKKTNVLAKKFVLELVDRNVGNTKLERKQMGAELKMKYRLAKKAALEDLAMKVPKLAGFVSRLGLPDNVEAFVAKVRQFAEAGSRERYNKDEVECLADSTIFVGGCGAGGGNGSYRKALVAGYDREIALAGEELQRRSRVVAMWLVEYDRMLDRSVQVGKADFEVMNYVPDEILGEFDRMVAAMFRVSGAIGARTVVEEATKLVIEKNRRK